MFINKGASLFTKAPTLITYSRQVRIKATANLVQPTPHHLSSLWSSLAKSTDSARMINYKSSDKITKVRVSRKSQGLTSSGSKILILKQSSRSQVSKLINLQKSHLYSNKLLIGLSEFQNVSRNQQLSSKVEKLQSLIKTLWD